MNGNETNIQKYRNKINKLLENNQYKDILEKFYHHISLGRIKSEASRYNYLNIVSVFLNETGKEIVDIRLDDYNYHRSKYRDASGNYQGVIYTALKEFSLYLFESDKTAKDYMEKCKRPKTKESQETYEKRRVAYLTQDEIKKYIQSTRDGVGSKIAKSCQEKWRSRDMAIIMLILNTGLRCAGVYQLDLNSLNLQNKTLITTEKESKIKIVKLSDQVLQCINEWLTDREVLLKEKGVFNENALFISRERTRLSTQGIANIVKKYSQSINKNITPHKLRATYGTQIYNATHDINLVKELMGHEDISTTTLYIREENNQSNVGSEIMAGLCF